MFFINILIELCNLNLTLEFFKKVVLRACFQFSYFWKLISYNYNYKL